MFGYVRPVKPELKVKDYEWYKALYCALCHSLGSHYGQFSRLFLSYDFVYLVMLLEDSPNTPCVEHKRCMMSPFHKKCCCSDSPTMEKCSGMSVILSYWKLRDAFIDEKGLKRSVAGILSRLLKPAYCKAAKALPDFDAHVKNCLGDLATLEEDKCNSLDRTADTFAKLLEGAAEEESDCKRKRILSQILYHTGRWIYLIDAVNDLTADEKTGSFNPVAEKYQLYGKALTPQQKEELQQTLTMSINSIASAYQLLAKPVWHAILENIIYIGFAEITNEVFSGKFSNKLKNTAI